MRVNDAHVRVKVRSTTDELAKREEATRKEVEEASEDVVSSCTRLDCSESSKILRREVLDTVVQFQ